LDNACAGVYQIIYLAPERLNTPSIRRLAASVEISMVCVDEAHCVSQWGQDFRPSYLEIPRFVESLPKRPVVAAFTATATPRVRKDTREMLQLRDPALTVTGFDRPNLYFGVQKPLDKRGALLNLVNRWKQRSGIVYCTTRKEVEKVCQELCQAGYSATRYHAGLPPEERSRNQEDFLYDRKSIIVATNAFGMGIDKSNVAYVIHYSMPRDLESYYQEAGRAGRDGSPAACVLLYEPKDSRMCRYLNNLEPENDEMDEATRKLLQMQAELRLKRMEQYVNTTRCLRQTLLEYFGEEHHRPCGNCSVCLARAKEKAVRRPGVFASLLGRERRQQNAALLDALREQRHRLARRYGVIPANIFTDATLRQMAAERPRSEAEFLEISGVTRVKYKQYGAAFAKVIARFEEGEG
jgi:ATP-dependent DNA helicase RecQ